MEQDSHSASFDMKTEPVKVIRPQDAPPAPPCQTTCFADITKEKRDAFVKKLGCPKLKKSVEENEASGWYDQCHKTDWCKKMREEKEREEKEKEEQQKILQERNLILEQHARQLETDFNDYKDQTDRRMTQLAELVRELLSEKNPPKLSKQKSVKA